MYRFIKKIVPAIFVALIFCSAASALKPLTWDDCVEAAMERNPDLRSSEQTLSSSQYQADAAYSGFWPQISADLDYSRGNAATVQGAGGAPVNVPSGAFSQSSFSTSIVATENIFAGFQDVGKVRQGRANVDVSRASLDTTKVQVSFDLKTSFAGLLYAQDSEKLTRDIIKRREDNARLVELRFEGGIENKGNLLLANASWSQARYDNLVAKYSIEVSREQLARVVGFDNAEQIRIAGSVPIEDPKKDPDFKQIVYETPTHRQAEAQERSTKAGVTIARSQFFPSVNITGSFARQGSSWDTNRNSIGANLSLPIFSGGNNYYTFKSSKASSAAASWSKESVDRQTLPKLKQTYRAFVESLAKLKVDMDFLEAASVRAEIARSKYNNGLLSFEDWDIIENDLITKQKTYLQSERDVILAEAAWQQTRGKGIIP